MKYELRDSIYGLIIGDALGVPVEFNRRSMLRENPVTDMREYGTHNQPKGTWSDDSSLTLALLDSLKNGYDITDIARKMTEWKFESKYTCNGDVFDIGWQTVDRINIIKYIFDENKNIERELHELTQFTENPSINGNGSLMKILPMYFFLLDVEDNFHVISEVSNLTHNHVRSAVCCHVFLYFIDVLQMNGGNKMAAYKSIVPEAKDVLATCDLNSNDEYLLFKNKFTDDIMELEESDIRSSGYVIDTLHASLWCFMTTDTFDDAVLKAVNLGDDTDTVGAVTGALAGFYYGIEESRFFDDIRNKELIDSVLEGCDEIFEEFNK